MGDETDWTRVLLEGRALSDADAATLEPTLDARPDDVRARVLLLGHYFGKRTSEARDRSNELVLWFIENRPDIPLRAHGHIHRSRSPEAYAKAVELWHEVLGKHPDDPAILLYASEFFMLEDPVYAERLLRRGAALEPASSTWPDRLAQLRTLEARHASDDRVALAREALAEWERALSLEASPPRRYCLMIDVATAAFSAGDHARATECALRLLAEADAFQGSWFYGNGIHYGHIVLGRVALAHDDVAGARAHLLAAAATPGSPQLDSFGPDQELAVELLGRGEREAVIAYAEACKRFHRGGLGMLGAAFRKPD